MAFGKRRTTSRLAGLRRGDPSNLWLNVVERPVPPFQVATDPAGESESCLLHSAKPRDEEVECQVFGSVLCRSPSSFLIVEGNRTRQEPEGDRREEAREEA